MASNNITHFPLDYFRPEDKYSAELIDLSDNRITSFPLALRHMTAVKTLFLKNNHITLDEIDQFKLQTKVVKLDLAKNEIATIRSGVFRGLESLQYLQLSFNHISAIEEGSFADIPVLSSLNMDYNRLTELHQPLTKNKLLRACHISHNQISTLYNDTFGQLLNLRSLYLSHNRISVIESASLSSLRRLYRITLMNNLLSNLPGKFLQGTVCSELNLQTNRLYDAENILEAIDGIQYTLREILLDYNQLTKLPDQLCPQFTLKKISVTFNNFKTFPNISLCRSLGKLDISHNEISVIYKCQMGEVKPYLGLLWDRSPIKCDCNLRWLIGERKSYFKDGGSVPIQGSATCMNPPALRGQRLMDLSSEQLQCSEDTMPVLCPLKNSDDTKLKLVVEATASVDDEDVLVTWYLNSTHPEAVNNILVQAVGGEPTTQIVSKTISANRKEYTFKHLLPQTMYNICVVIFEEKSVMMASECVSSRTGRSQSTTKKMVFLTSSIENIGNSELTDLNTTKPNQQNTLVVISCITVVFVVVLIFVYMYIFNDRVKCFIHTNFYRMRKNYCENIPSNNSTCRSQIIYENRQSSDNAAKSESYDDTLESKCWNMPRIKNDDISRKIPLTVKCLKM